MKSVIIIGYSGHAYVVCDIFLHQGVEVIAYCDSQELKQNPFSLPFLGSEKSVEVQKQLAGSDWFISIGNNKIRAKIYSLLRAKNIHPPINAIHPSATIGSRVSLADGIMLAANCTINPLAKIGTGVICNTACVIEHECEIGIFTHIAPGAVLAGNVKIGQHSFVGAGAVVRQGVTIGSNVIVGAGAVILKDVPDNVTIVGNPGKIIRYHD